MMENLYILIVDDELELISTLAERLEMRGIKTDFVTTGDKALELIKKNKYNVVLLDMVLQKMRGLNVLRDIKQISPETSVILMSGRCSEKDFENCKKEGAFDYLIKPVQIDVLIEKIKEAVMNM